MGGADVLRRLSSRHSDDAGCYESPTAADSSLRAIFEQGDANHDGRLERREVQAVLQKLGLPKQDIWMALHGMEKEALTFDDFREGFLSGSLRKALQGSGLEVQVDLGSGVVSLEHLFEEQFSTFRQSLGVSDEDFASSLRELTGGVTHAAGKSGSLFWFSGDRRYVLKSIAKGELDTLLKVMPLYRLHFKEALAAGRPCFLPRFMGAYRFASEGHVLWLVAMNNVFDGEPAPTRIYDLKGTTEDRWVEPHHGKVMKDLNFSDHRLCVPPAEAALIREAIRVDTEFLRQQDIMDYSLLLGICPGELAEPRDGSFSALEVVPSEEPAPVTFKIGLIDSLVEYTLVKKAAHWIKKPTIGCCNEIDTEPPDFYQRRFMRFINEKILDLEADGTARPVPGPRRARPALKGRSGRWLAYLPWCR